MHPVPKALRLESEILLAWTRRRPCFHCGRPAPSQAHHWPGRGRSGVRLDLCILAACAECHARCEGITCEGQPPIPPDEQDRAVLRNLVGFLLSASEQEWLAFSRERARAAHEVPW